MGFRVSYNLASNHLPGCVSCLLLFLCQASWTSQPNRTALNIFYTFLLLCLSLLMLLLLQGTFPLARALLEIVPTSLVSNTTFRTKSFPMPPTEYDLSLPCILIPFAWPFLSVLYLTGPCLSHLCTCPMMSWEQGLAFTLLRLPSTPSTACSRCLIIAWGAKFGGIIRLFGLFPSAPLFPGEWDELLRSSRNRVV